MRIKKSKKIIGLVIIAIFVTFISACMGNSQNNLEDSVKQPEDQPPVLEEKEKEKAEKEEQKNPDELATVIQNMSLSEKIGQLVMMGVEGPISDENMTSFIQERHVGGMILFARNIQNVEQTIQLTNSLKELNKESSIPLLIGVDEEGGKVTRMPAELLGTPTSRNIGASQNQQLAYDIGTVIAKKTMALGFNIDFAPVLDIDSNPNNPVIGDRSFGSDPEQVSLYGIKEMKGIMSEGMVPVIKHFPGHGDTSVDSHIGIPVVNHDRTRLSSFELLPFKKAIQNEADAIMIAHLLVPAYDEQNPASLSKPIITDLLREELGFEGVVVTDDMTMGAILENYRIGEAAVQSILAGSDLILICHGYEPVTEALDAVEEAVQSGKISEARLDQSVYRILALKQKYDLSDEQIQDVDVNSINQQIQDVLSAYH